MKKILLSGDSWGWVWFTFLGGINVFTSKTHKQHIQSSSHKHMLDTGPLKNSYPLLNILLENYGFDVKQIAFPGSSNFAQLEMLERETVENSYDAVIFLHTEPTRDIVHNYGYNDIKDFIPGEKFHKWSLERFQNELDQVYTTIYQRLNHIAEHSQTPILILGGHSVVSTEHLERVKQQHNSNLLHCVSKHILTDILEKYYNQKVEFHPLTFNLINHLIDKTWNPDLIDYFYKIIRKEIRSPDFHGLLFPDTCHMNGGTTVLAVEMILQYMEEHRLI